MGLKKKNCGVEDFQNPGHKNSDCRPERGLACGYQFSGILCSKVQGNISRNAIGSREVVELLLIQPYIELAAPGILVLLVSPIQLLPRQTLHSCPLYPVKL